MRVATGFLDWRSLHLSIALVLSDLDLILERELGAGLAQIGIVY